MKCSRLCCPDRSTHQCRQFHAQLFSCGARHMLGVDTKTRSALHANDLFPQRPEQACKQRAAHWYDLAGVAVVRVPIAARALPQPAPGVLNAAPLNRGHQCFVFAQFVSPSCSRFAGHWPIAVIWRRVSAPHACSMSACACLPPSSYWSNRAWHPLTLGRSQQSAKQARSSAFAPFALLLLG